jgi:hypothetical protein
MTGRQAARDESHDANIAQREAVDESKHDGHLTKGEQNRLNRSENRNSRRIHRQKQSVTSRDEAAAPLVSRAGRP